MPTLMVLLLAVVIAHASQSDSGKTAGNLEVLSDTKGVDFGPYLSEVLKKVRADWYDLIPEEARPPQLQSGETTVEFAILKDGRVAGMKIVHGSGVESLDRAVWDGMAASSPVGPLPEAFKGQYLALRMHFLYNPQKANGTGHVPAASAKSSVEVLTDTKGFDIRPYVQKELQKIRGNWHNLVPEEVRSPQLKSGKMSIEFAISKEGKVSNMRIAQSSGSMPLDRAAWGGITASIPFDPLPEEFKGDHVALRIHFLYNPKNSDGNGQSATQSTDAQAASH